MKLAEHAHHAMLRFWSGLGVPLVELDGLAQSAQVPRRTLDRVLDDLVRAGTLSLRWRRVDGRLEGYIGTARFLERQRR